MKYWKTALPIFALSASLALAEDFRTTKGKEYKNATVSRVEPDGIVIKFHGGIVRLLFTELPSDVQKKYEYDPIAAREYAAQRDRVVPGPTATPDANLRTSEADDAQTNAKGLNAAEQWVVAQVTVGKIADLSKQFPNEGDRQLSADFLEALLMGIRPDVKLHRHGVRINGACIDEPIDLENAQIPCDVQFDECRFYTNLSFARASIAGAVLFDRSTFKGRADFRGMKVGGDAFFNLAQFRGVVDFTGTDIGGSLQAQWTRFEGSSDFSGMKVRGGDVRFEGAHFDESPVYFNKVEIAGMLVMQNVKFLGKNPIASFYAMKVGGDAFFGSTVFEGFVSFNGAEIAGYFVAPAKLRSTANLIKLRVGGDALVNGSFEGPVDFTGAEIRGNFAAQSAKFQKAARIGSMKVGGGASFNHASFEGPVDLRYADFGLLDVSDASWPKDPAQFHVEGMGYKTILAAPGEPESHKLLLNLADQTAYSADVYSRLEEFFLRQGYRNDADKAFIAGKRRERKEKLHGLDWLGSYLLDWLVGYGRRPWQAGIYCAALIALGCVLFSPNKMEPQRPEDTPRVYSRFWYSLNLFLPVVDLQAGKVWKPKADQTFLRNYMRVHILLGWILIPLVLAALTGLIK